MQHTFNPDGTRNREFRPYIFGEEQTYETNLYDPFRSNNFGLYTYGVQPATIPVQEDVIRYAEKLHNPGMTLAQQFGSSHNTRYIQSVYTPNTNTHGQSTMYKKMYAV